MKMETITIRPEDGYIQTAEGRISLYPPGTRLQAEDPSTGTKREMRVVGHDVSRGLLGVVPEREARRVAGFWGKGLVERAMALRDQLHETWFGKEPS